MGQERRFQKTRVRMATLFDVPKENVPRLNQCYLCKAWHLEAALQAIEVPDQAGYVLKLGCQKCLDMITRNTDGMIQERPETGLKHG